MNAHVNIHDQFFFPLLGPVLTSIPADAAVIPLEHDQMVIKRASDGRQIIYGGRVVAVRRGGVPKDGDLVIASFSHYRPGPHTSAWLCEVYEGKDRLQYRTRHFIPRPGAALLPDTEPARDDHGPEEVAQIIGVVVGEVHARLSAKAIARFTRENAAMEAMRKALADGFDIAGYVDLLDRMGRVSVVCAYANGKLSLMEMMDYVHEKQIEHEEESRLYQERREYFHARGAAAPYFDNRVAEYCLQAGRQMLCDQDGSWHNDVNMPAFVREVVTGRWLKRRKKVSVKPALEAAA